jgi:flagellar motility protein MotE (MotC chaperone)
MPVQTRPKPWLRFGLLSLFAVLLLTYAAGRTIESVRSLLQPVPVFGFFFSEPVWAVLPGQAKLAAVEPVDPFMVQAEEVRLLKQKLAAQLLQVQQREAVLAERESSLQVRENEASVKEAALKENSRQVEGRLYDLQRRIELIRAMKVVSASALIAAMSDTEVLTILRQLEPKEAAKLLAAIDPYRAARLYLQLELAP